MLLKKVRQELLLPFRQRRNASILDQHKIRWPETLMESLRFRAKEREHSLCIARLVELNFLRKQMLAQIVARLLLLTMPNLVPHRMILPYRQCQVHPLPL
jgi:hypothetical protein